MTEQVAHIGGDVEYVDCPVCGPAPHSVWMDDGKRTCYVRCRACQTIYASPRASHKARYAWLQKAFSLGQSAFKNATSRLPALETEACLVQRHAACGRMLDIGCDLGHLFGWFEDPTWERYGVEIVPSAAAYAARTYGAEVYAGTLRQAAFPAASFDVATMLDTIYYLDDPRGDLVEVARIVRPGGLFAVELAGQRYQLVRSRGALCWVLDRRWTRLHTDSSYLFWFSPRGLARLLEDTGFSVVHAYVIGSPTSPNPWRNRLASAYRGMLGLGSHLSYRSLTWAPKYLLLARRR